MFDKDFFYISIYIRGGGAVILIRFFLFKKKLIGKTREVGELMGMSSSSTSQ